MTGVLRELNIVPEKSGHFINDSILPFILSSVSSNLGIGKHGSLCQGLHEEESITKNFKFSSTSQPSWTIY